MGLWLPTRQALEPTVADREGFERSIRLGPPLRVGFLRFSARGDSVAIPENQKAALADGLLVLSQYISHLFGCGDRI